MSFCRISGRSKTLPKPNFFPIIPPISLAHARKLCRITGKRGGNQKYVTLLEAGKRPACVRSTKSSKNKENRGPGSNQVGESAKAGKDTSAVHECQYDYKYVTPIFEKDMIEEEDHKAFEHFEKVLQRLKDTISNAEENKKFVYLLPSSLCGLILSADIEEAIRKGELEGISVSRAYDRAFFKVRGKPTIFVPLKEVDVHKRSPDRNTDDLNVPAVDTAKLFDGKGQNKETLSKQKQAIENRKKRTLLANRKIFEDLEKQAAEDMLKELERPVGGRKGSCGVIGIRRNKRAQFYRERLARFKSTYEADTNMATYGDWKTALQSTNVHAFNWDRIVRISLNEIDTSVPTKASDLLLTNEDMVRKRKRLKNVYVQEQPGLELVPMLENDKIVVKQCEVPKELLDFIESSRNSDNSLSTSSLKSMFAYDEALKVLPTLSELQDIYEQFVINESGTKSLGKNGTVTTIQPKFGCMYDNGDGLKFTEDVATAPQSANIVVGAIVIAKSGPKFIPSEVVNSIIVPGQRMSSVNGEFIPGACIRGESGQFQFIPGVRFSPDSHFIAGQFISRERGKTEFVKGQVIHTQHGSKFVEGETVKTPDGLKMIAGSVFSNGKVEKFVPGALVDVSEEEAKFHPGQLMGGTSPEDLTFIGGQWGVSKENQKPIFIPGHIGESGFVSGQMIDNGKGKQTFLPGDVMPDEGISAPKGALKFVPGVYEQNEFGQPDFVPGVTFDTNEGSIFIAGRLHRVKNDAIFVPGTLSKENGGKFVRAQMPAELTVSQAPMAGEAAHLDGTSLSVAFKKTKPKNGKLIRTKNGARFYADDEKLPDDLEGAEIIPGRMEVTDDGPTFVPGQSMTLNGIKSFIPGRFQRNADGSETFVPGKIVHTKNGPKFVCGQVIQTEDGEKFLPGIVMEREGGKIFVPAMEMPTKSGTLLIPGQVIRTDNGLKFVPGEIVATENGAQFVPGYVLDSPEGAKFIRGEVIETPDGPRLLPPDVKGDGQMDYCVQGFDINLEEARLLLGKSKSSADLNDLLGGVGGAVVSPEALKALAEGFQKVDTNVIPTMGATGSEDVDNVLQEELLDKYDSNKVRQVLAETFMPVLKKLCKQTDDLGAILTKFYEVSIGQTVQKCLRNSDLKLNPALDHLRESFESKDGSMIGNANEEGIKFLASIVTCSIPSALKACHAQKGSLESLTWQEYLPFLEESVEDSLKCIMEENGLKSKGTTSDVRQLLGVMNGAGSQESNEEMAQDKTHMVTPSKAGSKAIQKKLLETYDSPMVRGIIKESFITVITELGEDIDELQPILKGFVSNQLMIALDGMVVSNEKLKPSLQKLRGVFEAGSETSKNDAEKILNLVSGVITCSIPQALQDCVDTTGKMDKRAFKDALFDCAETSILALLQKNTVSENEQLNSMQKLVEISTGMDGGSKKFLDKAENELLNKRVKQKKRQSRLEGPRVRKVVMQSFMNVLNDLAESMALTPAEIQSFKQLVVDPSFKKTLMTSDVKLFPAMKKLKDMLEERHGETSEEVDKILISMSTLIAHSLPIALQECDKHSKDLTEELLTAVLRQKVDESMEQTLSLKKEAKIDMNNEEDKIRAVTKILHLAKHEERQDILEDVEKAVKKKKIDKKHLNKFDSPKVRRTLQKAILSTVEELGQGQEGLKDFINENLKKMFQESMTTDDDLVTTLAKIQDVLEKISNSGVSGQVTLATLSNFVMSCVPSSLEMCGTDFKDFDHDIFNDVLKEKVLNSIDKIIESESKLNPSKMGNFDKVEAIVCISKSNDKVYDLTAQSEAICELDKAIAQNALKKFDHPKIRQEISNSITATFEAFCGGKKSISKSSLKKFIENKLKPTCKQTVLSKMKLNQAMQKLQKCFESVNDDKGVEKMFSLICGIISANVVKALKKTKKVKEGTYDDKVFRSILKELTEDAVVKLLKLHGKKLNEDPIDELIELGQSSMKLDVKSLVHMATESDKARQQALELNKHDSPTMRKEIKLAIMDSVKKLSESLGSDISPQEKAIILNKLEKKLIKSIDSGKDLAEALEEFRNSITDSDEENINGSLIGSIISSVIPEAIRMAQSSNEDLGSSLMRCVDAAIGKVSDIKVNKKNRGKALKEMAEKCKKGEIKNMKEVSHKCLTAFELDLLEEFSSDEIKQNIKESFLQVSEKVLEDADLPKSEKEKAMKALNEAVQKSISSGLATGPTIQLLCQAISEISPDEVPKGLRILFGTIAATLPSAVRNSNNPGERDSLSRSIEDSLKISLNTITQTEGNKQDSKRLVKEFIQKVSDEEYLETGQEIIEKCVRAQVQRENSLSEFANLSIFDDEKSRQTIKEAVLSTINGLCDKIEGVSDEDKAKIKKELANKVEKCFSGDKKLVPSFEELIDSLEECTKEVEGAEDIANILTGVVAAALPKALKTKGNDPSSLIASSLKKDLQEKVDESLEKITEEKNSMRDRGKAVRALMKMAKDGKLKAGKDIFSECLTMDFDEDQNDEENCVIQTKISKVACDPLEKYDNPVVRKVISNSFQSVLSELCEDFPEVAEVMDQFIDGNLKDILNNTILSKKKLSSALENIEKICMEANEDRSEKENVLNLITGMIAAAIPGVLKECSPDGSGINERKFNAVLLDCVEDAVKSILEEDGIIAKGLGDDIKALVELAKDEDFDDAKTFFDKVKAVSELRCNNKFMDVLLQKLSSDGSIEGLNSDDVTENLITILGSKSHLKEAFEELVEKNPNFLQEVLQNLSDEDKYAANVNAVDLLHTAIVRTVEESCQRQLDTLIAQLEEAGEKGDLTNEDIKSMIRQAIGLAKFMRREEVAQSLRELLDDPVMIDAIKDDPIARDVLKKILLLRKLAGKDKRKKRKLEQLEGFYRDNIEPDDDDSSLRNFIRQSDALINGPNQSKLKKSKSMVKKSKSIIMTAKDIPMNAFMAIKNTADSKDEKWLKNFLSESVMEDIPWECSKALIIMKEGFQAIIPREAARSILLGDASYTLIDDNGIEFYLSNADKKKRKSQRNSNDRDEVKNNDKDRDESYDEEEEGQKSRTMRDVLNRDPVYQQASRYCKSKDNPDGYKSFSLGLGSTDTPEQLDSKKNKRGKRFEWELSEDEEEALFRKRPIKNFLDTELENEQSIKDSLEKYRPHNFEFRGSKPLPESADINDLRDYYSKVGSRHRALSRFGMAPDIDENGAIVRKRSALPDSAISPFEDRQYDQADVGHRSFGRQFSAPNRTRPPEDEDDGGELHNNPDLDDTTKFFLNKARTARERNKAFWQEEIDRARQRSGMPTKQEQMEQEEARKNRRIYDWESDTFLDDTEGGNGFADDPESRTRGIINKVKESTMALQDLNSQINDEHRNRMFGGGSRRKRQPPNADRDYYDEQQNYPFGSTESYGNATSRRFPQQTSVPSYLDRFSESGRNNDDYVPYSSRFGRDRMASEAKDNIRGVRGQSATRRSQARDDYNPGSSSWRDNDDVDVMIADLKKKTSGRDMKEVLRNIHSRPDSYANYDEPDYGDFYGGSSYSNSRNDYPSSQYDDYNKKNRDVGYGQTQNDNYLRSKRSASRQRGLYPDDDYESGMKSYQSNRGRNNFNGNYDEDNDDQRSQFGRSTFNDYGRKMANRPSQISDDNDSRLKSRGLSRSRGFSSAREGYDDFQDDLPSTRRSHVQRNGHGLRQNLDDSEDDDITLKTSNFSMPRSSRFGNSRNNNPDDDSNEENTFRTSKPIYGDVEKPRKPSRFLRDRRSASRETSIPGTSLLENPPRPSRTRSILDDD